MAYITATSPFLCTYILFGDITKKVTSAIAQIPQDWNFFEGLLRVPERCSKGQNALRPVEFCVTYGGMVFKELGDTAGKSVFQPLCYHPENEFPRPSDESPPSSLSFILEGFGCHFNLHWANLGYYLGSLKELAREYVDAGYTGYIFSGRRVLGDYAAQFNPTVVESMVIRNEGWNSEVLVYFNLPAGGRRETMEEMMNSLESRLGRPVLTKQGVGQN